MTPVPSPFVRFAAGSACAAFALQFVALDLWTRGLRAWLASPRLLLSLVASALLWAMVLALATTRLRRVAAAVASATVLVVQTLVFRYYRTPLDVQVAESALHAWRDVYPILSRAAPSVLVSIFAVAFVEHAALATAHQGAWRSMARLRGRGRYALGAAFGVAVLFGVELRRATPDLRAVHALAAVRRETRKAVGSRVSLPPLHPERSAPPDVLFVITESVRARDYGEDVAPETAAALPGRTMLREMRSVSSYTALSVSALLTGRSQEAPRDSILRAPSAFDYADAAGYEVGYWSAQSREVFETKEVHAAASHFVTAETLIGRDPDNDWQLPLDEMIIERFTRDLPAASTRALFAVLHLFGTHAPYHVESARAPFQPYDHVVTWAGMPELRNAYKNAIREQDHVLARAVRAFVERAGTRPWVVVFTSDHGEAFGEHGAIHHGQNLYDEQVHVPAWIAAGGGALGADEAGALAGYERRFVTHLDLLPTVLDAMGLWDNFATASQQKELRGRSLLRPFVERGPIPVTNCTPMFRCPLNTWGLYAGDHKLVAHLWDGGWECLVVGRSAEDGASEAPADAGDPACERLRDESRRHFPLLPNGTPNR